MAPRAYRLARRAESAAGTRQRILDAARDLYQERGVAATTLQAVAERADVSRGTIQNHFRGADGLVGAVADTVLESLELPDDRIFEGAEGDQARLRAFVTAMVRFHERSTPWWAVFQSEMARPELQAREAEYWATLAGLQARALGPDTADRIVNLAVGAVIHPATMGGLIWVLQQAGLGPAEIDKVIGDIVVAYVERARVAPAGT